MTEVTPAIRVSGLRTVLGGATIHDGLDLAVARGEVVGVVGASGSGKSVLLRTIVGLNFPAGGRIEVLGQDTAALDEDGWKRLRRRTGVLFQDGALFSSLTVGQNIQVPMDEFMAMPAALKEELTAVKLDMVGLSPGVAAKMPAELSGGMRKRVGLARALALDAELLFLDEPTAGLDPIAAADFDSLVRSLQRSLGLTVFMVTHDLDSLIAVCDRIAVLVDRRIVEGRLEALLANPHPWIQSYFSGPRGRAAAHA
jgi:phospholipid/cholesterol/gamma-HCH transport system ATP-binding protein